MTFWAAFRVLLSTVFGFCLVTAAMAAQKPLVIGMATEPTGLDPTIAAPVAIGQVTWQNIFEGLVTIDEHGTIQPQLAKSWVISDDGLTYRFTLRQDVRFHDGEVFNSAVAKASLDRARGDGSVNPQKRFFATITAIEDPDPASLIIRLSKPTGNLLYWLAWPSSSILGTKSAANDRTDPIGTGPYQFVRWDKGDKVVLAPNRDYWDKAHMPKLSGVTFRFISDPQAEAAALKAGDVDAFPEFMAPELFDSFKTDPKLVTVIGNTELKVVAAMNSDLKPFSDKRVRQALMMAVDRKTLVDGAWSGYGTAIGSHYTPNDPGYIDTTKVLAFNPAKARALLSQAGYPNGFSFTLKMPQMTYATRSAQILQALFADIGVTMTIEPTEFPGKWINDVFKAHQYEMTIIAHAEPMDIDIYSRPDYYFNYHNPAFDNVMNAVEATSDPARQKYLYGKAQTILAEDVPALYLFVMPKLGVWNKNLTGLWKNEPIPSNVLRDVSWQD